MKLNRKEIILDTNFFIDIVKFKIDLRELDSLVLGSYKVFTLHSVIRELEKIKNKNARVALQLLKKMLRAKKVRIKRVEKALDAGNADKALLFLASKDKNKRNKNVIIATNDRRLRKRLKALGTKTIYLRKRKQLAIG